jgi:hypothetical protein
VKTLCQKLITIDILLSHVKLHKMRIITHSSEQKKLSKKYMQKKSEKWQPRRQNRPSVVFGFIENQSVSVVVSVSRRALELVCQ